jgi:predicted RNA binding protein YcfA (HicA-like mRNA interferase family)
MTTRLAPVSRREFIRRLLRLGFDGPFSGGRHEFLVRNEIRQILPTVCAKVKDTNLTQ